MKFACQGFLNLYRHPKTLIKATGANTRGHWESSAVVHLDEAILKSIGSAWSDTQRIDPGWFVSADADDFKQRALDIMRDEFGDARLFVLKDPRFCRLLPFWLDVLEAFRATPAIIFTIRNPLEVAASL